MRKPKFNAWHTGLQKMFTAEEMGKDQLTLMPDGRGFANISSVDKRLTSFAEDRMIPLEYTGLEDATDTESYHKHLVLFDFIPGDDPEDIDHTKVGMIEWSNRHGIWLVVDKNGARLCDLWDCFKNCNGKVIGNFYENPGLLEEARK